MDLSVVLCSRKGLMFSVWCIRCMCCTHCLVVLYSRKGLMFSAVHDSFWTHPADVDIMNVVSTALFHVDLSTLVDILRCANSQLKF